MVWRARDRRAGRDVAVRVVELGGEGASTEGADTTGTSGAERFGHELRALTRLAGHPHVLDVLAAGIDDHVAWTVTPLAESSLWEQLAVGGPLPAGDVVSLCVALASALRAAHDLDVVHGDITPANVLLVEGRPVLADFGLAVLRGPGSVPTGDGASFGATPGWAAPERLDGSAPTAASDVYGLGATLWSASTVLRPPVHRPPECSVVPRGVDVVVASCCEVDPSRRPTAADVERSAEAERRRRRRYCPGP